MEGWARFALHTSSPAPEELRLAADDHKDAAPPALPLDGASWSITVSQDLMSCLRLLPLMAALFGMTFIAYVARPRCRLWRRRQ